MIKQMLERRTGPLTSDEFEAVMCLTTRQIVNNHMTIKTRLPMVIEMAVIIHKARRRQ